MATYLNLSDGLEYLKKHRVQHVMIHIKTALAPQSLRVRYFSSIIALSKDEHGIPDDSVMFPYDKEWQPKVDMYFEDGLSLRELEHDKYSLMEMHRPFEQKDMVGRYKGTAKERCELFFLILQGLEHYNITYGFTGWGAIRENLDWVSRTMKL